MANPLFAREVPTQPVVGPFRFESPDKSFNLLAPPGWAVQGRLQVEKPNNQYIVFDAKSTDGKLIFSGHPDLPQRYLVPGPWHANVQPGRRTKFGEGPTEQYLFMGQICSAQFMCEFLAFRRFGKLKTEKVSILQELINETRQGG